MHICNQTLNSLSSSTPLLSGQLCTLRYNATELQYLYHVEVGGDIYPAMQSGTKERER
jgi:hypothetical protein